MAAKWNLRNYEIFAHRGYYGDNKMPGFQACADKGLFIETDIVQTGSGTLYMQHERYFTYNGESVHISTLTDEQYLSIIGEDAVTLDAFLTWLKQYPDMRVLCDFYLGATETLAKINASGTMGQWIMNVSSIGEHYSITYPELSYCYTSTVTSEADLDIMRTNTNIVTSHVGDGANNSLLSCGGYVAVTADNVADYIALGYTWFQPTSNGTVLDALKEKLMEYSAPGYAQEIMLSRIADEIRAKTGETGEIAARNFPSKIRKLIIRAEGTTASVFNWKALSSVYNMSNIKGTWTDYTEINIDMNNLALAIPSINYVAFSPNGCVINISNCASATLGADCGRWAHGILEINFIGGIYPSGTLTRFGQSLNGDNDISDGEFTDGTTITGLYLDNITGFNAFLSSAKGTVNVVWEGTLNASVNISTANALTAESVNRLISCLADCSAGDAQTLTLGTNLLARVTDESKGIATARNWTLA